MKKTILTIAVLLSSVSTIGAGNVTAPKIINNTGWKLIVSNPKGSTTIDSNGSVVTTSGTKYTIKVDKLNASTTITSNNNVKEYHVQLFTAGDDDETRNPGTEYLQVNTINK